MSVVLGTSNRAEHVIENYPEPTYINCMVRFMRPQASCIHTEA